MAIGESLLKVTDYPFAYSIVLLWLKFSGQDPFADEAIGFFVLAGFAGTALVMLNPVGRIFKTYSIWVEKK